MTVVDAVVLAAAVVACLGALVVVVAAVVLVGQVRRFERDLAALRTEMVPLAQEARRAAGHAASELERVDAVLADTGSVTATVDSAARLAQRAFASPVVQVLALRAGTVGGLRRLGQPAGRTPGPATRPDRRLKRRPADRTPR